MNIGPVWVLSVLLEVIV